VYLLDDLDQAGAGALRDLLELLEQPPGAVALIIRSCGGALGIAFALRSALRLLAKAGWETVCIGIGEVSSAALDVFMEGRTRYLTKESYCVVHGCRMDMSGDGAPTIHSWGRFLEETNREMLRRLKRATGRDWQEALRGDVIIGAEEAVRCGIAHKIV